MPIYKFSAHVTVSAFTEVEASNETEAYEIASSRSVAGLCIRPFDVEEDEAWHIDTDGEAENISLSSVDDE